MRLTNSRKLLKAGFLLYRQDPRTRIISQLTTRGGWVRIAKYSTLATHRKAWSRLMADPKAIDG